MSRFDTQSADRTSLAVWVEGDGPAIVLVHGSVSDHTTQTPFIDELREETATFSMDRRGFGASGDTPGYTLEHYPDERPVAIEHLDFAIAEFQEMKMQPSLERALRHRGLLKA